MKREGGKTHMKKYSLQMKWGKGEPGCKGMETVAAQGEFFKKGGRRHNGAWTLSGEKCRAPSSGKV